MVPYGGIEKVVAVRPDVEGFSLDGLVVVVVVVLQLETQLASLQRKM